MKIALIGIGRVGSAIGFALVTRGVGEELVLVNRTRERAEGEALDLSHAAALIPEPPRVRAGSVDDAANSDIVVLSVAAPIDDPVQSRLLAARRNIEIFDDLVPVLAKASPEAVFVVVTNPVDVMTTHLWRRSGLPGRQVIGTGTLIDSARYRALLSREMGIHPDDIRAYILGEHGDSQFPALSLSLSGGEWVGGIEAASRLFEEARGMGYEVVRRKGHTSYAIAIATTAIVESVLADARHTFPISTPVDGFLGVDDVCVSVPAVVGRGGVARQLHPELDAHERAAFVHSAEVVRNAYRGALS